MEENRKHPRIAITKLTADISDGKGFYTGSVENISRFGMSITDLPVKIDCHTDILTAIVNGDGDNFKMFLKPKWQLVNGLSKCVGVQIESCSWGWTDFVMKHEAVDEDIWPELVN